MSNPLAKRRSVSWKGAEAFRTPLLVPSFSSKGFPKLVQLIQTASEFITESTLVSAYDIKHNGVKLPLTFPSVLFIDSGGYETNKDDEAEALGVVQEDAKDWDVDLCRQTLSSVPLVSPTVLIAFDVHAPLEEQIHAARDLLEPFAPAIKEIIVKPETTDQRYVQVAGVVAGIRSFQGFDVIGFSERELGRSLLDRMRAIAKVRRALDKAKMSQVIHIFGSLDTISSPLYFLAGADVFDGLTWLRYSFCDGHAAYLRNAGALKMQINTPEDLLVARAWQDNISYLNHLSPEMRRFLKDGEFSAFSSHGQFFERSLATLLEDLEEEE